jgi:hypothetical protein
VLDLYALGTPICGMCATELTPADLASDTGWCGMCEEGVTPPTIRAEVS